MRRLHIENFVKFHQPLLQLLKSFELKASESSEKDLNNLLVSYLAWIGKANGKIVKVNSEEHFAARCAAFFSFFHAFPQYLKIYKISSYFGSVLKDAPCNISARFLNFENEHRFFCLEFPEGVSFRTGENEYVSCCYVNILSEKSRSLSIARRFNYERKNVNRAINIICPTNIDNCDISFDLLLNSEDDISDVIKRHSFENIPLLEFILKSILYIDSGEPDLSEYKPIPRPRNPSKRKLWCLQEHHDFPVTRVGFNYCPKLARHVFEGTVRGHWRWQPYGIGLSSVKLIFIEEHIRHYGKEALEA